MTSRCLVWPSRTSQRRSPKGARTPRSRLAFGRAEAELLEIRRQMAQTVERCQRVPQRVRAESTQGREEPQEFQVRDRMVVRAVGAQRHLRIRTEPLAELAEVLVRQPGAELDDAATGHRWPEHLRGQRRGHLAKVGGRLRVAGDEPSLRPSDAVPVAPIDYRWSAVSRCRRPRVVAHRGSPHRRTRSAGRAHSRRRAPRSPRSPPRREERLPPSPGSRR